MRCRRSRRWGRARRAVAARLAELTGHHLAWPAYTRSRSCKRAVDLLQVARGEERFPRRASLSGGFSAVKRVITSRRLTAPEVDRALTAPGTVRPPGAPPAGPRSGRAPVRAGENRNTTVRSKSPPRIHGGPRKRPAAGSSCASEPRARPEACLHTRRGPPAAEESLRVRARRLGHGGPWGWREDGRTGAHTQPSRLMIGGIAATAAAGELLRSRLGRTRATTGR